MKKTYLLLSAILCMGITATHAQYKYTELHAFNNTDGSSPQGSLAISGNILYGMTYAGGANGLGDIFSVDTNGNGFTDLFDFNGTNGSSPDGDVTISGDTMYGMTNQGGAYGDGLIFSIQTNGTGFINLLDFDSANGANPQGDVILSGGTLYGMTSAGGSTNAGRIFSVQTNGSGYSDIFDFNSTNGANPNGSLLLIGNKLFGTAYSGGLRGSGCIFSINTNGGGYKALYNWGMAGGGPAGALILSGSTLYGTDVVGGGGFGDVFSIDSAGTNFNDYGCSFRGNNVPGSALVKVNGLLYGMFEHGCNCTQMYGTVFSMDTNVSAFVSCVGFDSSNAWYPRGSLIYAGHAFYGLAPSGTFTTGNGVVFKIEDTASALTSTKQLSVVSNHPDSYRESVYPNPSNGIFNIAISHQPSAISQIEVYNVLGEKVYTQFIAHSSSFIVDLRSQPSGVYFYRVISLDGAEIGSGKMVIQK